MGGLGRITGVALLGLAFAGWQAPHANAAYITVNGSCFAGNCASPDIIPVPGTSPLVFDSDVTLANGDSFNISGQIFATNTSANFLILNPIFDVKYLGPAPSQADTLNIDITQLYQNNFSVGTYSSTLAGFGTGAFGAGSSISVQNVVGGQGLPTLGPAGLPGKFNLTDSETLSSLGNPLTDSLDYTIAMGAGSMAGVIVEVAEPGSIATLGLGLIVLAASRRRRKGSRSR